MTPLHPHYGPLFRPFDRLTVENMSEWQRAPLFIMARHFHALHRLYGVASGFLIEKDLVSNKWMLTHGVAYDAYSRPMVPFLEDKRAVEVPVKNCKEVEDDKGNHLVKDWLLVLKNKEPLKQLLDVPVPAPDKCEIDYELKEKYKFKPHEVVLAKLEKVDKYGVAEGIDPTERTNAARSLRRPYLATGRVQQGTTVTPLKTANGWKVWIDTRTSGFLPPYTTDSQKRLAAPDGMRGKQSPSETSTDVEVPPVYFITFAPLPDQMPSSNSVLYKHLVTTPQVTISEASYEGFLLNVVYPGAGNASEPFTTTPLDVMWMGVEHPLSDQQSYPVQDTWKMTEDIPMTRMQTRKKLPWPEFSSDRSLSAEDLNNIQDTLQEMQWLHNRTLHDWGVGEGFSVSMMTDKRGVIVEPGVAFDTDGHEIILNESKALLVPPQRATTNGNARQTRWVTASFMELIKAREHEAGDRTEGVTPQRLPEAIIRWVDPNEVETNLRLRPGKDVILASVVMERGVVLSITSEGRRSAVPPKMPYLYSSRDAGVIEEIKYENDNCNILLLDLAINTTKAGFQSQPVYMVQLEEKASASKVNNESGKNVTNQSTARKQDNNRQNEGVGREGSQAGNQSVEKQETQQEAEEVQLEEHKCQKKAINLLSYAETELTVHLLRIKSSLSSKLLLELRIELLDKRSRSFFSSRTSNQQHEVPTSQREQQAWFKKEIIARLPCQFAWMGVEG